MKKYEALEIAKDGYIFQEGKRCKHSVLAILNEIIEKYKKEESDK